MYKVIFILSFFSLTTISKAQEINVTKIEIQGLKKTKESFIYKLLKIEKGLPLDTSIIKQDIQRLANLVSIAKASYELIKIESNSYQVNYILEENFTLIPQLNIWTVDRDLSYSIGLYEFNLLGRNIMLGGFYQYNGFNSYGLNFKAPYLFSDKIGMAVNYRNWKSKEPLYFNSFVANYEYNNTSFELIGLYEFNFKHSIELGGNLFKEEYHYIDGATVEEQTLIPLSVQEDKTMVKLNYKFNNIRYNYYLLSGFKNNLYFQTIVTENDFQNKFYIAWNDLFYYKQVGGKGNFATRLRVGLSTNNDSPFAPFALDNNVNIRGVGNAIDRGTGSIVWNVEYRQAIIDLDWFVLQSNVFVDAGAWRNPGGNFTDFTERDNLRVYAGAGLRFIHKKIYNAVFRIDYSHSITNQHSGGLVIGIGQYF